MPKQWVPVEDLTDQELDQLIAEQERRADMKHAEELRYFKTLTKEQKLALVRGAAGNA